MTPNPPALLDKWVMPPASEQNDPRWRDAFFATRLAEVTAEFIYGVPLLELRPQLRVDIRAYAESYTEDAVDRYSKILNAAERAGHDDQRTD